MTLMNSSILITLFFFTLTLASSANANDKRIEQIYKSKKEMLLDNEHVQVFRLTYLPGAESGMHKHLHPHRVVYVLNGGKIAIVNSDKHNSTKVLTLQEGQTLFVPANHHNVKNIGNTTVVMLETEIKQH